MLSNVLASSVPGVVLMVVLFGLIIVWMVFSKRSQAKRQQETMDMLNAIKPGNKVKTIGGICGIVVEVCPEDNTFVLETGTENSGKSYIKFDKQAVYQTDAVVEKATPVAPVEETKAEEVFEETKTEETVETAENTEETK